MALREGKTREEIIILHALPSRPYGTTESRLRGAWQAEIEGRTNNKKWSNMKAERLKLRTLNSKQSQHCQPANQGKLYSAEIADWSTTYVGP
eukprot:1136412-Pelagomonas_calceolata.AAC.1